MRSILHCKKKNLLGPLPELLVTDTNTDTDHRKLKVPFQGTLHITFQPSSL